MWWVPVRVVRLQWHLIRGIWFAYRAPYNPPTVNAQRVQDWLAHSHKILNIQTQIEGELPTSCGHLWLANHVSWLDIPLLGGLVPHTVFLAKAEIRAWPLIGALAIQAGTLFMARGSGSQGARHALTAGLTCNQQVVIFPEGTTTAGLEVKHFHARLTQAALDAAAPVQPVALRYVSPDGQPDRRAAYIDDDHIITSLWRIVRAKKIQVTVRFLTPIPTASNDSAAPITHALNRNAITQIAEQRIRAALQAWNVP